MRSRLFRGAVSLAVVFALTPLVVGAPAKAAPPVLRVEDSSITEGNSGNTAVAVVVRLSAPAARKVTFDYTTVQRSAKAGDDFTLAEGSASIAEGKRQKRLTFDVVGDPFDERRETFKVRISDVRRASVSDDTAVVAILDDDQPPIFSLPHIGVAEPEDPETEILIPFEVCVSMPSGKRITVDYTTADDSAIAGEDFGSASGVLTFNPGVVCQTIDVRILADDDIEEPERFEVVLSNPVNARIQDGPGSGSVEIHSTDMPALRFTEFAVSPSAGPGSEFVEIRNEGSTPVDLTQLGLRIGGQVVDVRSAASPSGSAAVQIAPGEYAWGIPNPSDPASIPAGADFVWGDAGGAPHLSDDGDLVALEAAGAPVASLDFRSLWTTGEFHMPEGWFPGSDSNSTQLANPSQDLGYDNGNDWCLSFPAKHSAGLANDSCTDFVINEVLYDFAYPGTEFDGDEGRVFVEIAGPGGGWLASHQVTTAAADGSSAEPNFTFTGATDVRMPVDGTFVLSDAFALPGGTHVPEADTTILAADPPNSAATVSLLNAQGAEIDRLGYGVGSNAEGGVPLPDIDPDSVAISLARDESSTDTDDNVADFHFDPTPTPGDPNDEVDPTILSVSHSDGLASDQTSVTVVARDIGDLRRVDGVELADNDIDAIFAGNSTTDTLATDDGCLISTSQDEGRGPITIHCTAPSNSGTPERGDFTVANPATIGGSESIIHGWTYTGVLNESDSLQEVDFCVLQFPETTSATSEQLSSDIFGRLFEAGLTEPIGAPPGVRVDVGVGWSGTDPTVHSGWLFREASFNIQVGNDDEYVGRFRAPQVFGTQQYLYTYRVSFDGGLNYTYCDKDGAGSNAGLTYEAGKLGVVTVSP